MAFWRVQDWSRKQSDGAVEGLGTGNDHENGSDRRVNRS